MFLFVTIVNHTKINSTCGLLVEEKKICNHVRMHMYLQANVKQVVSIHQHVNLHFGHFIISTIRHICEYDSLNMKNEPHTIIKLCSPTKHHFLFCTIW